MDKDRDTRHRLGAKVPTRAAVHGATPPCGWRDHIRLSMLALLLASSQVLPALGATDTAMACDAAAADPFDPALPDGVAGVPFDEIAPTGAIVACQQAVEEAPGTPRMAHQLGIALYAAGALGEAVTQFDTAWAGGHSASGYWLAVSLDQLGYGDPDAVMQLLRDSAAAGYVPAIDALATPPPAAQARIDPARFEQPDLVEALQYGDVETLLAFRSGLPFEASGLPSGLMHYLQGFVQELAGVWYCPTLLPVGIDTTLRRHIANRTWKPSTARAILRELPDIFGDVADATGRILRNPSDGLGADDYAAPGTELMAMKVEIETLKQDLDAQGRRDARLFHEMTQCTGPDAEALARSISLLILAFSEE